MQTKRSDHSVLSIDDALSEENYDQMELPSEPYATYKASLGPAKKKELRKLNGQESLQLIKVAKGHVMSLEAHPD